MGNYENEYEEALTAVCGCDPAYYSDDKDIQKLVDLVSKEVPKKGIMLPMDGFDSEIASHLCCPRCKKPITNVWNVQKYEPNYCHYCGQKLDWSKE